MASDSWTEKNYQERRQSKVQWNRRLPSTVSTLGYTNKKRKNERKERNKRRCQTAQKVRGSNLECQKFTVSH